MLKTVLAWSATLLLTGSLHAQSEPWANKLFSGSTTKDFGSVAKGTTLHGKFEMRNIYKVPLEITDVNVSCGRCVRAVATKMHLEPGEVSVINFSLETRLFDIPQKSFTIRVRVGPEFISEAILTVMAHARSDVVLNPGAINFGTVARGSTPIQHLDVEYAGALDWRILEIVKNGAAPFDLRVEEFKRAGQGIRQVGYRLFATLKPGAEPGNFVETVVLKTNDPNQDKFTFNITGTVQTTLSVSPSQIALADLQPQETREFRVIVRGTQPFRITGIDGLGQGIAADKPENAATVHILTLRCTLDRPGELRRTVVVRTDLGNESAAVQLDLRTR